MIYLDEYHGDEDEFHEDCHCEICEERFEAEFEDRFEEWHDDEAA